MTVSHGGDGIEALTAERDRLRMEATKKNAKMKLLIDRLRELQDAMDLMHP